MKGGKEIAVLPDSKELGEEHQESMLMKEAAEAYTVEHDGLAAGEHVLRSIKVYRKGLDEHRTGITRPLMESLAKVREMYKPYEIALADAEKIIKSKILTYTLKQEELQLAEAAKIEDKVAKGTLRADTAAGKLTALDAKKVQSNVRVVKKLEIVDESLVPREFLDVNRMRVTEALWAGIAVPGARLKEEKQIVIK